MREFRMVFGKNKIDIDQVTDGIAEFEKTLATSNSRFDQWQLGKKFTHAENQQIVAFLKTLTGDQPMFTMPILPPSADSTPRPTPFK